MPAEEQVIQDFAALEVEGGEEDLGALAAGADEEIRLGVDEVEARDEEKEDVFDRLFMDSEEEEVGFVAALEDHDEQVDGSDEEEQDDDDRDFSFFIDELTEQIAQVFAAAHAAEEQEAEEIDIAAVLQDDGAEDAHEDEEAGDDEDEEEPFFMELVPLCGRLQANDPCESPCDIQDIASTSLCMFSFLFTWVSTHPTNSYLWIYQFLIR